MGAMGPKEGENDLIGHYSSIPGEGGPKMAMKLAT